MLRHPDLELVGCWVHSDGKQGKDVGELVGPSALGVRATTSAEEILGLDADCVVYAPLIPNEAEVAVLLRSGKNVVTPVGWVFPSSKDTTDLEGACRDGGVTLHATGIHPGGITERFPLMVSALTAAATHVRAGPELRTTQQVGLATAPIDSPIGTIAPGQVAARRFQWEAMVGDRPVVTAAVNWLMGQDGLEEGWGFGQEGERFEVEVTGDPTVRATFHGLHPESVAAGLVRNAGDVATANHCVSAVPYVCRAEPGIKTYLDLPLIAGRPAVDITGEGAAA